VLLLLALTAVVALALFAAATVWWLRRENGAVGVASLARPAGRPLPLGCDVGATLMAAAPTDTTPRPAPAGAPARQGGGGPSGGAPAPKRKVSPAPTRRTFLRTAWLISMAGALGAFGAASLRFLWPNIQGAFGAELDIGAVDEILAEIEQTQSPFRYPAGRMWVSPYDPATDPEGVYADVALDGAPVMALYQKCVHLGCTVPWQAPVQRFQCPCHGSNYNILGEYILGPAPRGLDRFPTRVENGRVIVDTGTIVIGPSRETKTI
jgi:cytochrome b6-f complex iron-sulfur subunit